MLRKNDRAPKAGRSETKCRRSVSLKVIVNIDQNVSGYSQFAYASLNNFIVNPSIVNQFLYFGARYNAKTLKALITGVGDAPHESVISDRRNHLHPVPRFSQPTTRPLPLINTRDIISRDSVTRRSAFSQSFTRRD